MRTKHWLTVNQTLPVKKCDLDTMGDNGYNGQRVKN